MSVRREYLVDKKYGFVIDYEPQSNGTIEMYARRHPQDRHGKSVTHHHLYNSKKICVSAGREPRSLSEAEAIAKAWAEGYSQYIRTGNFPGS